MSEEHSTITNVDEEIPSYLLPPPPPVSPPGEEAGEEAAKNSFKWSHKGIERHLVRILGVNMPYRGLN